ncbi:diaminopimelate epimerase [Hasllibacter halocynthiae]|uniref:Diaminopimelate epimerase n=1 Tax=Hasllibacter halocynthiae TaxID=595589 RepID=A0A2T0X1Z7_9RHOB|nr:diaminopimelate epimerase [Hasllibacter halocynthiae]PRY92915.1 diaminopimelate epimerase [Hasllibacter halocynthiae]
MIPFLKMHGLGNDFVVLDARPGGGCEGLDVTPDLARAIGDRHRGVGFDQLAVIADDAGADALLTFWNADGTTAGACGNATRCVAAHLARAGGRERLLLRTERGVLDCRRAEGGIAVNMGAPMLDWREVPLAEDVDLDRLPVEGGPAATGMGNPHCTFFVEDAEAAGLAGYARFETHPLFPERTNVQVASVAGPDRLRVRVHERGVGPTLASGSSACAVACAAHRRGLTGRRVILVMDGGELEVDWRPEGEDAGLWMTGPTAHVFDGVWHG